jgi:methanogenic corrinoid protein MtbC1
LLARVVGAGRAIGDVAGLSSAQLEELDGLSPTNGQGRERRGIALSHGDFVTRILDRVECFDHAAVRRLLGDAIVGLGVSSFVHDVALPLVHRVGTRWADGDLSIAQEHLSIGMLRTLLAGLPEGRTRQDRPILLATPSGEQHEIGLLLVALLARDAGANVVSLGVDLPAADIVTAAARTQARVVGLSLVGSGNRARATNEVQAIHDALPAQCELWLGGADASQVAAGVRAFRGLVLETLQATETELARITPKAPPHA